MKRNRMRNTGRGRTAKAAGLVRRALCLILVFVMLASLCMDTQVIFAGEPAFEEQEENPEQNDSAGAESGSEEDKTPEDETPEDETPEDETPEDEMPEDEIAENGSKENGAGEDELSEEEESSGTEAPSGEEDTGAEETGTGEEDAGAGDTEEEAEGVRILEYAADLEMSVYWSNGGNARQTRPESLEAAAPLLMFCKTEEKAEQDADEGEEAGKDAFTLFGPGNLEDTGLEEMPSLEMEEGEDSAVFRYAGTGLPSRVEMTDADGEAKVWQIQWNLLLPELDGYTLYEVPEADLEREDRAFADRGAGWYYVLDAVEEAEPGVRVDGWSEDLEQNVYWVDMPDQEVVRPDSGEFPPVELAFHVEEEDSGTAEAVPETPAQTLTSENMNSIGLEQLPDSEAEAVGTPSEQTMGTAETEGGIQEDTVYTVQEYGLKVSGSSLPAALTEVQEDGSRTSYSVAWKMELPQVEHYALTEITDGMLEEDLEMYFYARQSGPGIYYVSEQVLEAGASRAGTRTEISKAEGTVSQKIYWVDNGNEGGLRPSAAACKKKIPLQFVISDTELDEDALAGGDVSWTELSEDTLSSVILEKMPEADVEESGGVWTYSLSGLPSELTVTDEMGAAATKYVYWKITAPEEEDYLLTEVTEEGQEGVSLGWYYVAKTDFQFRIDIRWGELEDAKRLRNENLEKFYLKAAAEDMESSETQLKALDGIQLHSEYDKDIEGNETPNRGTVFIEDLPKYTLDGKPITYTVGTGQGDDAQDRLNPANVEGMEEGDYFKIRYDNTDSALGGTTVDEILDGGSLVMTLTGEIEYKAEKVWLDEADGTGRPTVTFYLWRYRAGESYTTAAQVSDGSGQHVVLTAEGGVFSGDSMEIEFTDAAGEPLALDKYDVEGHRYIYVVREVIGSGGNRYEQVFGEVDEDGNVSDFILVPSGDDNRLEQDEDGRIGTNNEFVYNGGTISNRLTDSVETTVTKDWKAEAFQTHFGDIKVELSLESRPRTEDDEPEGQWKATGTTVMMDDFYAEHMADSKTMQIPKYGSHGEELEYRWVESAVYQGEERVSLTRDSKDGYTFTLTQNGEEVTYQSVTATDEDTGTVVITNRIADTITYEMEKTWVDKDGNDISGEMAGTEVTFAIYRSVSGVEPDYEKPYCTFVSDGVADSEAVPIMASDGVELTMQETAAWKASVSGLPEYDESGLLYDYYLLELANPATQFVPQYRTERTDNGGYLTRVTNGPGGGHSILVQKYWTDSSDINHREAVTVAVYSRKDKKKITEVTFSEKNGGSWNAWIGIGDYEPEDVFIVETAIGGKDTGYKKDSDGTPLETTISTDSGIEMNETALHQFEASYHKYEASYEVNTLKTVGAPLQYTVTNRRLGNVNITVKKEWMDGEGGQREEIAGELKKLEEKAEEEGKDSDETVPRLALYLDFALTSQADAHTMTHHAGETPDEVETGYISVNLSNEESGNGVSGKTVLALDLETGAGTRTYYFNNLPKYNLNGSTVSYEVRESWVIEKNGEYVELTDEELRADFPELYKLYKEYAASITSTYELKDGLLHTWDQQTVELTNRLTGSKQIQWSKRWNDEYTYLNKERPDLYISLYQLVHKSRDAEDVSLEVYQRNYLWEQAPDEGATNWIAQFGNLPKYDQYGYEIIYYAVEQTMIAADQLGYQPVQYSIGEDGGAVEDLGSSTAPTEDAVNSKNVYPLAENGSSLYALKEGGTFTNSIAGEATVTVRKLWENLPGQYPSEDLPEVTFYLYRGGSAETEDNIVQKPSVASLTIKGTDWESILSGNVYTFTFSHEGKNQLVTGADGTASVEPVEVGAVKLPKFDEKGSLYQYVLREKVQFGEEEADSVDAGQVFHEPVITNYTATNTYDSAKGSLSFQKYLKLAQADVYPAVFFRISRTYTTSAGIASDPEYIQVKQKTDDDPYTWMKDDGGEAYLIWYSKAVKEAAESAGNTGSGSADTAWISGTFTLEGLELYAPNGSEYVYTIEEVKTDLNGYDTWAVTGEVEENEIDEKIKDTGQSTSVSKLGPTPEAGDGTGQDADPPVSAAFINKPSGSPERQILKGKKVWKDAGNVFEFRPVQDDFTVTVYREAASQPGQNNGIEKTALTQNTDYKIKWDTAEDGYWTYTITRTDDTGGLDRYAPNGMEWTYTVVEETPIDHYNAVKDTATERGEPEDSTSGSDKIQLMTDLENSIMTSESFRKYWVDSDGEKITEDYLGYGLEVTFALQVREKAGSGDGSGTGTGAASSQWEDAKTYFAEALSEENYNALFGKDAAFTKTLEGYLGDALWSTGGSFADLPAWITKKADSSGTDGGKTTELEYRVVESRIKILNESAGDGGFTQTITVEGDNQGSTYTYTFDPQGLFQPYYGKGQNAHSSADNDQYNQLTTMDFTVTKEWEDDADNRYGTRPEAEAGSAYDWKTSFVIQRLSDGGTSWETVLIRDGEEQVPLIVELYGKNPDARVVRSVTGLPQSGVSESGQVENYQYRARELNPLAGEAEGYTQENLKQYLVEDQGTYAGTYTAAYTDAGENQPPATVAANTMNTTVVYAEKKWENHGGQTKNVSLTLQYLAQAGTGGVWKNIQPTETVTLDGTADSEAQDRGYWEYAPWKAEWTGLPEVLPGSKPDGSGKTQYRIREAVPAGYVTFYNDDGKTDTEGDTAVITNRKVTSLTVEKRWRTADTDADQWPEVTVALWRTIGTPGDGSSEVVMGTDGVQTMAVLNEKNGWTFTFTGLPEYDGEGADAGKYIYYARETQIGTGTDAVTVTDMASSSLYAGDWLVVHQQSEETSGAAKTTVLNIGRIDLSGTKTWKDDGNAYGTRPETLELELWRTTEPDRENSWKKVTKEELAAEKASLIWAGTETDVWTYQYEGLLAANEKGEIYTYRVSEPETEEYDPLQNGYDFTNTLADSIHITVTKQWKDGNDRDGLRPDSIALTLYQNGEEYEKITLTGGNLLQKLFRKASGSGNVWSYTFEDLPEYDENGVRYEYTVKEDAVPSGYQADGTGEGTAQGSAADGFAVTNTLTTEVRVKKLWQGTGSGGPKEASVGLYRSLEGTGEEPEPVMDEHGKPLTVTLDEENGWEAVFEELPRFDEEGKRWLYSVKEETVDGEPAETSGFVIHLYGGRITDGQDAGAFSYRIVNVAETVVSGTKTWLDNHNAYGTRPEKLELTLYRSTAESGEEEVTAELLDADGASLAWSGMDTDRWIYAYSGLPGTDDEGNPYIYRVEETAPEGYVAEADGYDFTNTLTDTAGISVAKIWEDRNDSSEQRPEEIELILYGNGEEIRRVKVGADTGKLEAFWNQLTSGTDNTWVYTFDSLPVYDENGTKILYSVKEIVPEGYEVQYQEGANTITNVKRSSDSSRSEGSSEEDNTGMTVSTAVQTGPAKTGDHAKTGLWTAAAAVSAAFLTVSGVYLRRRKRG